MAECHEVASACNFDSTYPPILKIQCSEVLDNLS